MFTQILKYWMILSLVVFVGFTASNGIFADDLDIDEGTVSTFASKRAAVNTTPTIDRDKFIESLPSGYIPTDLNIITYDDDQGKLVPLWNNSKVSAGQKFMIHLQSHYEEDLYFYAFRVTRNKRVKKIFPVNGEDDETRNPIEESVEYKAPSSDEEWLKFGSRSGKERIYVFISKRPIRKLNRVRSKKKLDKLVKKYRKNEEYRERLVLDEVEVEKEDHPGNVYSNVVGFEKVYAQRFTVVIR